MTIVTVATVPEPFQRAWLQHLRDFDVAHPGCHFKVVGNAPRMYAEAMLSIFDHIEPSFASTKVIKRNEGDDDKGG